MDRTAVRARKNRQRFFMQLAITSNKLYHRGSEAYAYSLTIVQTAMRDTVSRIGVWTKASVSLSSFARWSSLISRSERCIRCTIPSMKSPVSPIVHTAIRRARRWLLERLRWSLTSPRSGSSLWSSSAAASEPACAGEARRGEAG